jgi:hypothetical protein
MEDSDEDYPTSGIEFNVSTATNNEANIDTSSDVDQYFSSDGSDFYRLLPVLNKK